MPKRKNSDAAKPQPTTGARAMWPNDTNDIEYVPSLGPDQFLVDFTFFRPESPEAKQQWLNSMRNCLDSISQQLVRETNFVTT